MCVLPQPITLPTECCQAGASLPASQDTRAALCFLTGSGSQTIYREPNFLRKPIYKLVFKDRHLGQQHGKS